MIKITVITSKQNVFYCKINSEQRGIETSLTVPYNYIKNPVICQKCHTGKSLNHCDLLESLLPVLVFFSDLVSFENIYVVYEEDNYRSTFLETAQRAGFILCIFIMFHSNCDFFYRFKPFLKFYRANITYEIFLHFILTTALIKRQIDLNEIHSHIDLFSEVKKFSSEIKERILCIFNDAKMIHGNDAAINALNIIFSLSDLSADGLKDFYEELILQIKNIPAMP